MDIPDLYVRWTVRLGLISYAIYLALCVNPHTTQVRMAALRLISTIGCGLLVIHVILAFHFHHHWSHQHAYTETTRQVRGLIGLDWGWGLYFNYTFLAIWTADVTWSWSRPASYQRRPRWIGYAVHVYLIFIAVNGAIVFEAGRTRWVSILIALGLCSVWLLATLKQRFED